MKDYTTGVQQECRSPPSPLHPGAAIPSTLPSCLHLMKQQARRLQKQDYEFFEGSVNALEIIFCTFAAHYN